MTRKEWTDEEKQSLFELLSTTCLTEAIRVHAINTGRSVVAVRNWYKYNKKKGKIPQSVLDAVAINNEETERWSQDELNTLLKLIEENPNNFSEAYRIHADNTGRTVAAVKSKFQEYRTQEDAKVCMITIGKKKRSSPNRKNIYPGTKGNITTVKKSVWKRIISAIFG